MVCHKNIFIIIIIKFNQTLSKIESLKVFFCFFLGFFYDRLQNLNINTWMIFLCDIEDTLLYAWLARVKFTKRGSKFF